MLVMFVTDHWSSCQLTI